MDTNTKFHKAMVRHTGLPIRHTISLSILLLLMVLIFLQLGSTLQADSPDPFPNLLTIPFSEDTPHLLNKTGESARKAFIFPVYRIAHYTDAPSGQGNILDQQSLKAVRMIFQREIGGQRIQKEVKKAIRERVSPQDWELIKDSAATYCQPYLNGKVNEGDLFSVIWYPDGWLISEFNGKEINRIRDPRFARALWSIWVGQQSLVNEHDLLGEWGTKS